MADKWQALHNFWSGFGINAYDESTVPDDAELPYITYSAQIGQFENILLLSANIWDSSTSWAFISQKADEIAEALKNYMLIPIDGKQYLFLTQGTPFAQRMQDEDSNIRRIYLNVMGEFFTHS